MNSIHQEIKRLDSHLVEAAKALSSATLHEAYEKRGAAERTIKPVHPEMALCGSALTVSCESGDNLGLHVAIALAEPGDVLVATINGDPDFGYWGEIMAVAAIEKGIAGLAIDGCVRDLDPMLALKFPIFAKGLCIKGTKKKSFRSVNHPIQFGNVPVSPGDLVLGDADGVVVIAQDEVPEVIDKAVERERKEKIFLENLRKGKTTLELLGLDEVMEKYGIRL